MYATSQAMGAYKSQNTETLSPRAIEYRVFSQITSRLESAKDSEDPNDMVRALGDNMMLWNALSADVMTKTNELPENLRAQIIYLAKYMSHHTSLIRKGESDATAMIDINKMMMAGLSQTSGTKKPIIEQQTLESTEAFSSFVAGA